MALPATESFTDSNGTQLTAHSSDWTLNSGDFDIQSNSLACDDGGGQDYIAAHWNADAFSDDQYSEAVVAAIIAPGTWNYIGVSCRCASGATNTFYSYIGVDSDAVLAKTVAGTDTALASGGDGFSVNDDIRIEAEGTTITPLLNDSEDTSLGAQTDSSISSGYAGIAGWQQSTTDRTLSRIDDWEGGDLAGAIIAMDALTLASGAQGLTLVPGAVTKAMDALTLAGSAEGLTWTGAYTAALNALTLASGAQGLTVVPGAVSLAMAALTLAGSAEGLSVYIGLTIALAALTLAGSAESATLVPGAVTKAMDALTLSSGAQGLTVVPGAATILANAITLSSSAEGLTVSPGAVALAMDALTVASGAQGLTVAPGAVALAMDALTLTVLAAALAVAVEAGKGDVVISSAAVTDVDLSSAAVTLVELVAEAVTALVVESKTRD